MSLKVLLRSHFKVLVSKILLVPILSLVVVCGLEVFESGLITKYKLNNISFDEL